MNWERDDVLRAKLGQDLLNSLGSLLTVFQITLNNAWERIEQVRLTGVDPRAGEAEPEGLNAATIPTPAGEVTQALVEPDPGPTLEAIRDRVRSHIRKHFREHALTGLVAGVLAMRGFQCDVSPPGKDQGVDILAGAGPLGLDSPTLIVEVKSEPNAVAAPVVRGLQGALLSHRADQGLLVAWGGITRDARAEIRKDRLTMRVWDADGLIDEVFDVYDRLPEPLRLAIPLNRAWVLVEDDDQS